MVVPVEKFFSTLRALHENLGHARVPTMWNKVDISRLNTLVHFTVLSYSSIANGINSVFNPLCTNRNKSRLILSSA